SSAALSQSVVQQNWPVAGSSDSRLSTNPCCCWMRGRNCPFSSVLNSSILAGSITQVMILEIMKCLLGMVCALGCPTLSIGHRSGKQTLLRFTASGQEGAHRPRPPMAKRKGRPDVMGGLFDDSQTLRHHSRRRLRRRPRSSRSRRFVQNPVMDGEQRQLQPVRHSNLV